MTTVYVVVEKLEYSLEGYIIDLVPVFRDIFLTAEEAEKYTSTHANARIGSYGFSVIIKEIGLG